MSQPEHRSRFGGPIGDDETERKRRAAVLEADQRFLAAVWPLLDDAARQRARTVRVLKRDVTFAGEGFVTSFRVLAAGRRG